ncbi:MAG: AbrB/MazE/SpoVT family DNA-binding domain-containing protein [Peptococcaceae bacterium]|nr:AbrB/MazE/SpoVT family DNA-binding domain-containing protein [Peptococcaceae bacterium]
MLRTTITLSSKRQITVPAEIFRSMQLKKGQKLIIELEGDKIIISARPESLTKALMGSAKGVFGKNSDEVDKYVRKERQEWDR